MDRKIVDSTYLLHWVSDEWKVKIWRKEMLKKEWKNDCYEETAEKGKVALTNHQNLWYSKKLKKKERELFTYFKKEKEKEKG